MIKCPDCGSYKITTTKRTNNGWGDRFTADENDKNRSGKAEFRTHCEVCSRYSFWCLCELTSKVSFIFTPKQKTSYVKPDFTAFFAIGKAK